MPENAASSPASISASASASAPAHAPAVSVPRAPALCLAGLDAIWLSPDGEILRLSAEETRLRVMADMPIVCNADATARKLGIARFAAYDVLELFAFVHPAVFAAPTPAGLTTALSLPAPASQDATAAAPALLGIAGTLLKEIAACEDQAERRRLGATAWIMGMFSKPDQEDSGWPWAPAVLKALGLTPADFDAASARGALAVWNRLPEWSEFAPAPPATHFGIEAQEAEGRLSYLTRLKRHEPRHGQKAFTAAVAEIFNPADSKDNPHVLLAEAGTGVGKTLGYLAPATLWAEKNGAPVWISTYTRNLQRQIDQELSALYPDASLRRKKAVVRKGRENYLCLLNFEEATVSPALSSSADHARAMGLMARWAGASRDGDLQGGDFPGWLAAVAGPARTLGLADRRGECIYSACPHYRKCFVERSIRRVAQADIVIANHALIMRKIAMADARDPMPTRFIFDEGHHVFDAADSAFSLHLSGMEGAELRRWILGGEDKKSRSRMRGLARRLEDLIAGDDTAVAALQEATEAAHTLPAPAWRARMAARNPQTAFEHFLAQLREQVYARAAQSDEPYSLETDIHPLSADLAQAAAVLAHRLEDLRKPLDRLAATLLRRRQEDAATLDTETRQRLEAMAHSIQRRGSALLEEWIGMLRALDPGRAKAKDVRLEDEAYCDWFSVERAHGRELDIGMHRHWIDPAEPFAAGLRPHLHGAVITSATLRDGRLPEGACDTVDGGEKEEGWETALASTGAGRLSGQARAPVTFSVPSPFDYARQSRVIVVTDVSKKSAKEVASAFRALFLAAGGGALGLFTAIRRLQAVYETIATPLAENNIRLYGQHVENMDIASLIDIFRMEENACLLGTDATRDGVDVPGPALRLVVYDRVPWPRPTILHRARRAHFGKGYDDMLTRMRLKQAYGRLIRRQDDYGVFVVLDSSLPTRLTGAFPPGVEVLRLGLKDAVHLTQEFLCAQRQTLEAAA